MEIELSDKRRAFSAAAVAVNSEFELIGVLNSNSE